MWSGSKGALQYVCYALSLGRNPEASTHRSPLARMPLEHLCSGRGHLLIYQDHAATSSSRDDPFTSALDHPMLLSLPSHPQTVPDPRLPDPALGMGNCSPACRTR